jgi:hypothetical protein
MDEMFPIKFVTYIKKKNFYSIYSLKLILFSINIKFMYHSISITNTSFLN